MLSDLILSFCKKDSPHHSAQFPDNTLGKGCLRRRTGLRAKFTDQCLKTCLLIPGKEMFSFLGLIRRDQYRGIVVQCQRKIGFAEPYLISNFTS